MTTTADERPSRRVPGVDLSSDDVQVLAALAAGRGPESIARELGISDRTLRRRLRRICDVLAVGAPIEAVIWAVRRGLI